MTLRARTLITALALAALPRVAAAQVTPAAGYTPPDDTQAIKTGAVLFFDATFQRAPTANDAAGNPYKPSAFNGIRAYINITGNISHLVAFRITPDISRESGAGATLAGSMVFRMKYVYGQFNLDDWTGMWKQTWVRLGVQQTPLIDTLESVYRYRFQGTVFPERDGGLASSDAGVSFHTNLPNNFGDVHAGFYNGEGYSKAETNQQKSFQMRVSVRPLARVSSLLPRGLRLHFYTNRDHYVTDAPRTRNDVSVTFEHKHLNMGVDYITRRDQTLLTAANVKSGGYSFYITPIFKEKGNGLEALFRYDVFKPNSDGAPTQKRTIAGLAYWFPHPGGTATAALLFGTEIVKSENFVTPTPTSKKLILHGLISF